MERIKDLFGQIKRPEQKCRRTERGDLLEWFCAELNKEREGTEYKPLTIKSVAFFLTGIKTKDLYFIKSSMEDKKRRGMSASKYFWWAIKPHQDPYENQHRT